MGGSRAQGVPHTWETLTVSGLGKPCLELEVWGYPLNHSPSGKGQVGVYYTTGVRFDVGISTRGKDFAKVQISSTLRPKNLNLAVDAGQY